MPAAHIESDWIGFRSGRVEVIAFGEKHKHRSTAIIKCDCGTIRKILVQSLAKGIVKSCGCINLYSDKDYLGKAFSDLTVVRFSGRDKNGQQLVIAKCICGKENKAYLYKILSGTIKSCGCRHKGINRFTPSGHKRCRMCLQVLSIKKFGNRQSSSDRKEGFCFDCMRVRNFNRAWKNHGITIDDKIRMMQDQENKCAIRFSVLDALASLDHDHKTGKIREILCKPCNNGLGFFRDNTYFLRTAALYLERHGEYKMA